jgi:ribonuclease BN (tRNA processing enzyme)
MHKFTCIYLVFMLEYFHMELIICGTSPSWASPGGSCSGYLVKDDGHTLMIDCGNGALSVARQFTTIADIDAVFLTHLHGDHISDLLCLAYAIRYGWPRETPLPVWGPQEMPGQLRQLALGCGAVSDVFDKSFDLRCYSPGDEITTGPLLLKTMAVPHLIPTVAVDVSSSKGLRSRFTFSADCGPNEALPILAKDTPLLLCEATMPEPNIAGTVGFHLDGSEAGQIATAAGAKELLLTHYADELADHQLDAASETFSEFVGMAKPGLIVQL